MTLKEHRNKAILISLIAHSLLLLLFWWFRFATPPPPEPVIEGILVNLGNSDNGSGDIQPLRTGDFAPETESQESSIASSSASTSQTEAIDNTSQQGYQTQDFETVNHSEQTGQTSESAMVNSQVENTNNNSNNNTSVSNNTASQPSRVANPNALFKAKNGTGTGDNNANTNNGSTSQGIGTGSGDMGATNGDPNATNYGAWSFGSGDNGIGLAMTGRRFKTKPIVNDDSQETGTVLLKIKVDKNGKVLNAEFYPKGSSTQNRSLINKAIEAVKKAYLNESDKSEQTGLVKIIFKVR